MLGGLTAALLGPAAALSGVCGVCGCGPCEACSWLPSRSRTWRSPRCCPCRCPGYSLTAASLTSCCRWARCLRCSLCRPQVRSINRPQVHSLCRPQVRSLCRAHARSWFRGPGAQPARPNWCEVAGADPVSSARWFGVAGVPWAVLVRACRGGRGGGRDGSGPGQGPGHHQGAATPAALRHCWCAHPRTPHRPGSWAGLDAALLHAGSLYAEDLGRRWPLWALLPPLLSPAPTQVAPSAAHMSWGASSCSLPSCCCLLPGAFCR